MLFPQELALDSFELFARQSQSTEGLLRVKLLQTLFDLLVLHGIDFGAERNFGVCPFASPRRDAGLTSLRRRTSFSGSSSTASNKKNRKQSPPPSSESPSSCFRAW